MKRIQMNSTYIKTGHVPDSTNVDNKPVTEIVTERFDSIHLANAPLPGNETDLLASPILKIEREEVIAPEADPEEEQEELQDSLPRTHQTRVAEHVIVADAHGVEWTWASLGKTLQ
jgi:hypothetical protein